MGARTLKKKLELNYRRGNRLTCCGTCQQYVPQAPIYTCNGNLMRHEPRCRVMGMDNSRRYRVQPIGICDAHKEAMTIRIDDVIHSVEE